MTPSESAVSRSQSKTHTGTSGSTSLPTTPIHGGTAPRSPLVASCAATHTPLHP